MAISSIRKIARNTVSLVTSDVVNKAANFVLYALVARFLGTFEFGQMALAFTLFYAFQVLAMAGLKNLITREVARDTTKTEQYLVNGSAAVAVFSLLSTILLLSFVRLLNYSTDTASIIILLSLGLLPYSLSTICEAVFQGWEKMQYIAYANVPVNIAKVSLAFLILQQGYSLYYLVILILVCHVATLCVEWSLMLHHISRPRVRVDPRFCLTMTRSASTFLGITGIVAISLSLNIVLLSKLTNETEVGLYSAAAQLIVPLTLVFQNIVLSVFPMMCRQFRTSIKSLKRTTEYLLELLLAIALPIVVGLLFLAEPALFLLYRDEQFLLASGALRILAWRLILLVFIHVLGRVLLASMREKVTLRIVAVNILVNLVLGLILINQYGLIGAAVAALLTEIVSFFQHYLPVSRQLSGIPLGKLVWKPLVASTCIAVYLALVRSQAVLLTVVSAGVLYTGVLLALTIWSTGSFRQFKARYLYLWSE